MKRKSIIGLLIVGAFIAIVISLGCIEKETTTPLPTEELEALRAVHPMGELSAIEVSERAPDLWHVATRYDNDAIPSFIAFNLTTKEEAYYYLNKEKEFWSEENLEFFGRRGVVWYILKNGKVIDWGTHGEIMAAGVMPAPIPTPKPISTLIEEGYMQYVDSEFKFSIYYPGNWIIIPYERIPYAEMTYPGYIVEAVNFCDPDTMVFYAPKYFGRESCGYFIQVAAFTSTTIEGDLTSKSVIGNCTVVERYVTFPVCEGKHFEVKCSGLEELFEKNKDICNNVVNSFTVLEPISEEEIWEVRREEPISNIVISNCRANIKENLCQYICDVTNHNDFAVCVRVLFNYTYKGEDSSEQGYTRTIESNETEWTDYTFSESDAISKFSSDFQCTVLEMKKII